MYDMRGITHYLLLLCSISYYHYKCFCDNHGKHNICWRCDGKPARMRISGLLDNAAAIASFGPPLEPLQRILYASLDHLAAKCFEHPTQPAWREGEVSAKLHAAGDGVNSCAGGGLIVGDTHSAQNPVDLMFLGVHRLDLERAVPSHWVL